MNRTPLWKKYLSRALKGSKPLDSEEKMGKRKFNGVKHTVRKNGGNLL